MKILVTVKEVTDPDANIRLKADKSGIESEGIEFKMNPFDENAVEEALVVKSKFKGEVVLVTIGQQSAVTRMRVGLAMGADRGIHVEGDDMQLDSDLVARILAKLVEQESPDMVLLGKQAIDGDCNQVGQLLAEYLGWPQACFISELEMADDGKSATATREVDGGLEQVKVDLPAVFTADLRLNEPRYASLPGIMKAKRKKVAKLSLADLGVDPALKVTTLAYDNPPQRAGGIMVSSVEELVDKLKTEAKVL